MQLKKIIVGGFLLFAATTLHAQNSKDNSGVEKVPATASEQQFHMRDGITHRKVKGFKWKKPNVKHSAQYEYYDRVETAARDHKRTLRKLSKPQYADFMYYGHKRKPKKHAAGKLQYCNECGIRH